MVTQEFAKAKGALPQYSIGSLFSKVRGVKCGGGVGWIGLLVVLWTYKTPLVDAILYELGH
jgi:hypothetical protein